MCCMREKRICAPLYGGINQHVQTLTHISVLFMWQTEWGYFGCPDIFYIFCLSVIVTCEQSHPPPQPLAPINIKHRKKWHQLSRNDKTLEMSKKCKNYKIFPGRDLLVIALASRDPHKHVHGRAEVKYIANIHGDEVWPFCNKTVWNTLYVYMRISYV